MRELGAIKTMVLVTKQGGLPRDKTEIAGSESSSHSNIVQTGSMVKENEHANRQPNKTEPKMFPMEICIVDVRKITLRLNILILRYHSSTNSILLRFKTFSHTMIGIQHQGELYFCKFLRNVAQETRPGGIFSDETKTARSSGLHIPFMFVSDRLDSLREQDAGSGPKCVFQFREGQKG